MTTTRTPTRPTRRRPLARAVCAVMLGGTLLLSACGGGADATGTTAAASSSDENAASASESTDAFRECLVENGVELPETGQGGPPADGAAPAEPPEDGAAPTDGAAPPQDDAFAAAQEACADLAPEGGPGGMAGGPGGMGGEEMQAYTDCLTEQGVELPERTAPSADDGAGTGTPPAGGPGGFADLDESDPGVAACADLRPEMPERPTDQGTTSDSESSTGTSS